MRSRFKTGPIAYVALGAYPVTFLSLKRCYDFDKVDTKPFQGWMYFETDQAYVKRKSLICPCFYRYKKIHVLCSNANVFLGESLSQTNEGKYEHCMNILNTQIYLYPTYLQLKFIDKKKEYTIMMKRIEDYKFVIRSLKIQKQQKLNEKDEFLMKRSKH